MKENVACIDREEIRELIRETESKYGRKLYTANDFEEFAEALNRSDKVNLSASTLKRLWGYVSYSNQPRISTLNILARYNGYPDFPQYRTHLQVNECGSSEFILSVQVLAAGLLPNQLLEVAWAPNRYLLLRHVADTNFVVETAKNSKLKEGDSFSAPYFEVGQPLVLPWVMRDGERLPSYIAGKSGGLTLLNLPDE